MEYLGGEMKVHKITGLYFDFEDYSNEEILNIAASELSTKEHEVIHITWDDNHPLNKKGTDYREFFPDKELTALKAQLDEANSLLDAHYKLIKRDKSLDFMKKPYWTREDEIMNNHEDYLSKYKEKDKRDRKILDGYKIKWLSNNPEEGV